MLWRWNTWRRSQRELWIVDGRSRVYDVAGDFLAASRRLLAGGVVLAWWLAVGELGAYLLVLPAGVSTLASRIFELLHYGVRYQEASLCLLLALIALVLGAIALRIPRHE
jgi:ABC-type Fe3+ transport system permease subunit